MAKIELYCKEYCPFCSRAKTLLESLNQAYTSYDITEMPEKREEMLERSGGRHTVPQIFIDGHHIGGCDDLFAVHAKGELKPMLGLEE